MLEASSGNIMAVRLPQVSQPDISEAYSGNTKPLSSTKVCSTRQPGMLEVYSGNIMAMTFPQVSQPDISESHSGNIMALSFP